MQTQTDPACRGILSLLDEPFQLREWGSERAYPLPAPSSERWIIGAGQRSWLRLQDNQGCISRRHAVLTHDTSGWLLTDADSKNGVWFDGERQAAGFLRPGGELRLGQLRLVVDSRRTERSRSVLHRVLGWGAHRAPAVERALSHLHAFAAGRVALAISGEGDLSVLARQLHREVLGAVKPFVVVDPGDADAHQVSDIVREMPRDGRTICIWAHRTPARLELADDRRIAVCARSVGEAGRIAMTLQAPAAVLQVPPLAARQHELAQIIQEYAMDAVAEFGASVTSFTNLDLELLLRRAPTTLAEVELVARRLVAIRKYKGVTHAAPHLGVSHSALSRWLSRREAGPLAESRGTGEDSDADE